MNRLLVVAAFCFAFSSAAIAATAPALPPAGKPPAAKNAPPKGPGPWQDGKVIVDNQKIADALRAESKSNLIHEATARVIGPLIYADNKLSPNENDLLNELLSNAGGVVTVTAPDGSTFTVPPLSQAASFFLQLSNPPDIDTLWMQGREPMQQLIDVTLLNPFVEGQVQRYIAQQLYLSWAASNALNNYKPLRSTIAVALDQLSATNPATQKQARKLFYNAMVDVDHAEKDAIPNSIYAGLQQQEAAGN